MVEFHYAVQSEGRREPRFLVMRLNSNGSGREINSYRDEETAAIVADFLAMMQDQEVR